MRVARVKVRVKVRVLAGVVLVGSLLTTVSCGAEQPVSKDEGFARVDDGDVPDVSTRLFESYRQTARTRTETVRLPAGTRQIRVRLDCIADTGSLKVAVLDGEAAVPCGQTSQRDGYIGLDEPKPLERATSATIVVTAPREAVWSVAVDAGSGETD